MLIGRRMGSILILMAACGYATVPLFGKWLFAEGIDAWSALSWRFGAATLILWPFVLRLRGVLKGGLICLLIGLLGDTLQTSFFFLTIPRVGASMAALLLYTFPFFVFLIQRFIFKQPATRLQWIALLISFTGGILAISPFEQTTIQPEYWSGVLFGLGTAITYACYIAFGAYFTKKVHPLFASAQFTSGAFIGFLVIASQQQGFSLPAVSSEWLLCGAMALIGTIIPLLCLIKGMQLVGATQTSLLFTVEPVVTILLATLFFEESLPLIKILGCVLILSASILIQKTKTPALITEIP